MHMSVPQCRMRACLSAIHLKLADEWIENMASRDASQWQAAARITAEVSGGARLSKMAQPLLIGIAAHLPRAEHASAIQHGRSNPQGPGTDSSALCSNSAGRLQPARIRKCKRPPAIHMCAVSSTCRTENTSEEVATAKAAKALFHARQLSRGGLHSPSAVAAGMILCPGVPDGPPAACSLPRCAPAPLPCGPAHTRVAA